MSTRLPDNERHDPAPGSAYTSFDSPPTESAHGTNPLPQHHGEQAPGPWRHRLMMLACCIPMLILVIALVVSGTAGGGALLFAFLCLGMMAMMMFMMPGGHRH